MKFILHASLLWLRFRVRDLIYGKFFIVFESNLILSWFPHRRFLEKFRLREYKQGRDLKELFKVSRIYLDSHIPRLWKFRSIWRLK